MVDRVRKYQPNRPRVKRAGDAKYIQVCRLLDTAAAVVCSHGRPGGGQRDVLLPGYAALCLPLDVAPRPPRAANRWPGVFGEKVVRAYGRRHLSALPIDSELIDYLQKGFDHEGVTAFAQPGNMCVGKNLRIVERQAPKAVI